jgi:hypothetical protein
VFLKTKSPDSRDKLILRWKKGALSSFSDFGTPLSTTKYSLCVYDQNGLVVEMQVPAGGTCSSGPCWGQTGSGFRYADAALTNDGAQRLILRAGAAGKAKILVGAKGPNLGMPAMLSVAPPLTVQVKNGNGECWGAVFSAAPIRNTSELFKAKGE